MKILNNNYFNNRFIKTNEQYGQYKNNNRITFRATPLVTKPAAKQTSEVIHKLFNNVIMPVYRKVMEGFSKINKSADDVVCMKETLKMLNKQTISVDNLGDWQKKVLKDRRIKEFVIDNSLLDKDYSFGLKPEQNHIIPKPRTLHNSKLEGKGGIIGAIDTNGAIGIFVYDKRGDLQKLVSCIDRSKKTLTSKGDVVIVPNKSKPATQKVTISDFGKRGKDKPGLYKTTTYKRGGVVTAQIISAPAPEGYTRLGIDAITDGKHIRMHSENIILRVNTDTEGNLKAIELTNDNGKRARFQKIGGLNIRRMIRFDTPVVDGEKYQYDKILDSEEEIVSLVTKKYNYIKNKNGEFFTIHNSKNQKDDIIITIDNNKLIIKQNGQISEANVSDDNENIKYINELIAEARTKIKTTIYDSMDKINERIKLYNINVTENLKYNKPNWC